jgi:hypothetical protein
MDAPPPPLVECDQTKRMGDQPCSIEDGVDLLLLLLLLLLSRFDSNCPTLFFIVHVLVLVQDSVAGRIVAGSLPPEDGGAGASRQYCVAGNDPPHNIIHLLLTK